MSEAKPFASLSSGLLARKGGARPAMRPQVFGQFGASLEDLGWNDLGGPPAPQPSDCGKGDQDKAAKVVASLNPRDEAPRAQSEVAMPVVKQQRAEIEARLAQPQTRREAHGASLRTRGGAPDRHASAAPAARQGKTAFTLRIEAERHLRLRLASAVTGRSAQQLLTEALDQLLDSRPDVTALAAQVQPRTGERE